MLHNPGRAQPRFYPFPRTLPEQRSLKKKDLCHTKLLSYLMGEVNLPTDTEYLYILHYNDHLVTDLRLSLVFIKAIYSVMEIFFWIYQRSLMIWHILHIYISSVALELYKHLLISESITLTKKEIFQEKRFIFTWVKDIHQSYTSTSGVHQSYTSRSSGWGRAYSARDRIQGLLQIRNVFLLLQSHP